MLPPGLILNCALWKQAEEGYGVFGVQEKMKGFRGQAECSRRLSTAEAYGDPQSVKKQAKGRKRDSERRRRESAIPGRVNFMEDAVECWFPVHSAFWCACHKGEEKPALAESNYTYMDGI